MLFIMASRFPLREDCIQPQRFGDILFLVMNSVSLKGFGVARKNIYHLTTCDAIADASAFSSENLTYLYECFLELGLKRF